jgi:hypothetical protein
MNEVNSIVFWRKQEMPKLPLYNEYSASLLGRSQFDC